MKIIVFPDCSRRAPVGCSAWERVVATAPGEGAPSRVTHPPEAQRHWVSKTSPDSIVTPGGMAAEKVEFLFWSAWSVWRMPCMDSALAPAASAGASRGPRTPGRPLAAAQLQAPRQLKTGKERLGVAVES